jgi:AmmeMemoRadiSam system protein B
MLKFAALTPHPPIIIPEIGGKDSEKTKKTIVAMEKLSEELKKTSPDTIIVISPHGHIYPERINVCGVGQLAGDLSQFGAVGLNFKFQNDLELAGTLAQKAEENGVQTLLYDNSSSSFELDHGTVVPLYFLTKKLKKDVKIIPIAYSYQDKGLLFAFGEVIQEVAIKAKKNIAIIASGDLSHRLIQTAPAGYNASGKEFDKLIINYLKNKDTQGILEMDDEFIEEAGECGYRSILILIGVLSKIDFKPEILSYEGPFGVGYAVINFKIL